ncbi:MAG: hypothetical protein IIA67_04500 [Planctomycetes bacterium]|nr:hypothetical protein [Planctomycetota bacterium]
MKSAMFALLAAAMIVGSSGCCSLNSFCGGGGGEAAGCSSCGGGGQLLSRRGCDDGSCEVGFQPGPPTAQVAYPYYTVRGPRDFLARNPRSVGR